VMSFEILQKCFKGKLLKVRKIRKNNKWNILFAWNDIELLHKNPRENALLYNRSFK
jgi:hypothetical protein